MPKVEQLDWNKLIPSHKEKPIKPLITLKVKSKKKEKGHTTYTILYLL